MIEYISKADIFQETVLRVDEIGEKKRKKEKRKGNAVRSRNNSNRFHHTCMQNTRRNSQKINTSVLRIKHVTFHVFVENPSGVFWHSCQR